MLRDHRGVQGAKPRLKLAKEELPELSREYLRIRNQQMQTKNLSAEMMLAERRGELIEKRLVEQQAAYLLVALRQRILAFHTLRPENSRSKGCSRGDRDSPAGDVRTP